MGYDELHPFYVYIFKAQIQISEGGKMDNGEREGQQWLRSVSWPCECFSLRRVIVDVEAVKTVSSMPDCFEKVGGSEYALDKPESMDTSPMKFGKGDERHITDIKIGEHWAVAQRWPKGPETGCTNLEFL